MTAFAPRRFVVSRHSTYAYAFACVLLFVCACVRRVDATPKQCIWLDGGLDSLASNQNNWDGDCGTVSVPGSADTVIIDGSSATDPIIDSPLVEWGELQILSSRNIRIGSGNALAVYSGSITTGGYQLTVAMLDGASIPQWVMSVGAGNYLSIDGGLLAAPVGAIYLTLAMSGLGAEFHIETGNFPIPVTFRALTTFGATSMISIGGSTTSLATLNFEGTVHHAVAISTADGPLLVAAIGHNATLSGNVAGAGGPFRIGSGVTFSGTVPSAMNVYLLAGATLRSSVDKLLMSDPTGNCTIDSALGALTYATVTFDSMAAVRIRGTAAVTFTSATFGGGVIARNGGLLTLTAFTTSATGTRFESNAGPDGIATVVVTSGAISNAAHSVQFAGAALTLTGSTSGPGLTSIDCSIGAAGLTIPGRAEFISTSLALAGALQLTSSSPTAISQWPEAISVTATGASIVVSSGMGAVSIPTAVTFASASIGTFTVNTPTATWTNIASFIVNSGNILQLTAYGQIDNYILMTGGSRVRLTQLQSTAPLQQSAGSSTVDFAADGLVHSGLLRANGNANPWHIENSAGAGSTVTISGWVRQGAHIDFPSGTIHWAAPITQTTGQMRLSSNVVILPGTNSTIGGTFQILSGNSVLFDTTTGSIDLIGKVVLQGPSTMNVTGSSLNTLTVGAMDVYSGGSNVVAVYGGVPFVVRGVATIDQSVWTCYQPTTFHFETAPVFQGTSAFSVAYFVDCTLYFAVAATITPALYNASHVVIAGTNGDTIVDAAAVQFNTVSVKSGAVLTFAGAASSTSAVSLDLESGAALHSTTTGIPSVTAQALTFNAAPASTITVDRVLLAGSSSVNIVAASTGTSTVTLSGGTALSVPPPNGLRVTYGGGNDGTSRTVTVTADAYTTLLDFGASPVNYVTYPGQTNPGTVNLAACFNAPPSGALPGTVTHNPPFACRPFSSSAQLISSSALLSSSAELISSSALPLSSSALPLSSSALPLSSSALPLSSSALPLSSSALPLSSSALPLSSSALPLSSSALPLSSSALPLSSSALPLSSSALPLSSSAELLSSSAESLPSSSSAVPAPPQPVSSSSAVPAPPAPVSSSSAVPAPPAPVSSSSAVPAILPPSSSAEAGSVSSSSAVAAAPPVSSSADAVPPISSSAAPAGVPPSSSAAAGPSAPSSTAVSPPVAGVSSSAVSNNVAASSSAATATPAIRTGYRRIVLHFGVALISVTDLDDFFFALRTALSTVSGAPISRFEVVYYASEDKDLVQNSIRQSAPVRLLAADSGFQVWVDVSEPATDADATTRSIVSLVNSGLGSSIHGVAINPAAPVTCTDDDGATVSCNEITGEGSSGDSGSKLSTGAIAGVIIGAVILLAIIVYLACAQSGADKKDGVSSVRSSGGDRKASNMALAASVAGGPVAASSTPAAVATPASTGSVAIEMGSLFPAAQPQPQPQTQVAAVPQTVQQPQPQAQAQVSVAVSPAPAPGSTAVPHSVVPDSPSSAAAHTHVASSVQPAAATATATATATAPAPGTAASAFPFPAGAVASGKDYNLPDGYFLKADGTIIDYLGAVRSQWPEFAAHWAARQAAAAAAAPAATPAPAQ